MHISYILLVLYLGHVHHVSAILIGGRTSCGASRTVTATNFVSSNCYRLTNANAILACSRYSNRPTVVNTGTSIFSANCNDGNPLLNGPRFGTYPAAGLYFPDLQLVSSDTGNALLGQTSYLIYDATTGYLQQPFSPPYDVTQVYSFTLINKLTGATSDPVYFTAKLAGCQLVLAGPSSITICTGPTVPPGPTVLGGPVATYTTCNPVITGVIFDASGCPIVLAATNGDAQQCYIGQSAAAAAAGISAQVNNGPGFPGTNVVNYILGGPTRQAIPQVKFCQTLSISATPTNPEGPPFTSGSKPLNVCYDPTCNVPTVTTAC